MTEVLQLRPGFADPARDSQQAFRAILDAISHPGRIGAITAAFDPPPGIGLAAAAAVLTLVDLDTRLWLSPALRETLPTWLRFHCGCPLLAGERLEAAFGLVAAGDHCPPLDTALLEDPERPDLSTTLIVECAALGGGRPRRLTGPGVDGEVVVAPRGPAETFWEQRAALRPLFPMGVELILTAGDRIMALPRTTLIEEID